MEAVKITLSALWVARMLTGLLGDVLRFLEPGVMGQLAQGRIQGLAITHGLLLVTAVLMVVPILMVVASVTLPDRVNRRANLVAATGLFLVDLVGLPSYTSASASFLIVVGLALNALTVWYAWRWR